MMCGVQTDTANEEWGSNCDALVIVAPARQDDIVSFPKVLLRESARKRDERVRACVCLCVRLPGRGLVAMASSYHLLLHAPGDPHAPSPHPNHSPAKVRDVACSFARCY